MTSSIDLRFADDAVNDLDAILQFTLERWGQAQEEAYRAVLRAGLERLSAFPEIGRPSRSDRRVRELIVGQHIIVYRYDDTAGVVYVARIVSAKQRR